MSLIKLESVTKIYQDGINKNTVIDAINLDILKEQIVVILGPSGSGKTTLLNILSGLEEVSAGKVIYNDIDITNYKESKRTKFRKENIGFIFQNYNLLEHLTVYENICVGSTLSKSPLSVTKLIKAVALTSKKNKHIYQLSGGEQQRVSIARALAKNPKTLFCDEPTGALDEENGKKVLERIVKINEELKTTIIIITHNPSIALIGDRIIKMNSGKIISDKLNTRINPLDISWG